VDINEILKTLPPPVSNAADRPGEGISGPITAVSASRTSPSTSRRFSDIFRTGRSIPAFMMIEAMAQTAGVIGIKSVEGT